MSYCRSYFGLHGQLVYVTIWPRKHPGVIRWKVNFTSDSQDLSAGVIEGNWMWAVVTNDHVSYASSNRYAIKRWRISFSVTTYQMFHMAEAGLPAGVEILQRVCLIEINNISIFLLYSSWTDIKSHKVICMRRFVALFINIFTDQIILVNRIFVFFSGNPNNLETICEFKDLRLM